MNTYSRFMPASVVAGGVGAAGVAAAFTWWAWMGRLGDTVYPTWTGIGCVLTLIAIGIVGATRLPWYLVAVAMTLCFTVSYAVTVMPGDDTGLSGVGVLMVLVGMAAGSAFVCGMTALCLHRPDPPDSHNHDAQPGH